MSNHVATTVLPPLGLGTLGNKGADATTLVEAALAEGYRHIDTAEYYGNEEAVGRGIANSAVAREDIWLTTKVLHPKAPVPRDVRSAAEASLRRLGVDHVDALLMHWPNPRFELETVFDVFSTLREEGLARVIGVSNFPVDLLRRASELDDALAVEQVEYHPYIRQDAVLTAARERGITVTAHTPLARGRVVEDPVLEEIAEEHGRTAAQVALRWLIQQELIAAIPGGRPDELEHLGENLGALDFSLTSEEMTRIAGLATGLRIVDGDHAPEWDV